VKTATADAAVDPAENLDDRKVSALRRAGRRLQPPIHRIDLVTVVLGADGADVHWVPCVA
jgi:hypothetical protein